MIRAKSNLRQATKYMKRAEKVLPAAYYSAINRVAQRVKTEAGREVRKKYYAKSKDISQTVSIRRGSVKKMGAEIRWKGPNIPLIRFRANPNQPLKYGKRPPKVLKAGVRKPGTKALKGGFIARVGRGGHVGVFKRVGRKRLPIEEVYGPAAPVMVNEPGILDSLVDVAKAEMDKRIEHEIKRRLEKGGMDLQ